MAYFPPSPASVSRRDPRVPRQNLLRVLPGVLVLEQGLSVEGFIVFFFFFVALLWFITRGQSKAAEVFSWFTRQSADFACTVYLQ